MKRIIFLSLGIVILAAMPLNAQKLMVGSKAPDLKVEWLDRTPGTDSKATMVEFFHSSNKSSEKRLEQLDRLAKATEGKVSVVVVTRESDEKVTAMLKKGPPAYFPAYDEGGKNFSAFSVQYVPYSVIYDKRGRILWLGNPTSLTEDDILKLLK